MSHSSSDKITFQITVSRLILSTPLPNEDIRVTVGIDDVTKITCSGELSEDGLIVTWNHPFLFTASSSATCEIAICILPEELTPEWDKQPLGNQIVADVASLLGSGNTWQYSVVGLHDGYETLSMTCTTCHKLVASDGHDCFSALRNFGKRLSKFRDQFKNVAFVSTQIELRQAMLDLCPMGPNHTDTLNDLARSFSFRHDLEGNISDLNRANQIRQTRLDLCPPGHSEHASALGELAASLWKNHLIQGNETDLNRVIEMRQKRLDLCPLGHTDHPSALGNLASSLQRRFNIKGDVTDLNRAIEMKQKRLDICPSGHPDYESAIGNLAISLQSRYGKQHNLGDLSRVIDLEEKRLELCPPGHPNHGLALSNLAISLRYHYKGTKTHSDWLRAIHLFKKALDCYPVHHSMHAAVIEALAQTILLPYTPSQRFHHDPLDHSAPLPQEAFETYRLLKGCGPAVSLDLWDATQAWVQDAEKHNHLSVLEAYHTSLNTLDHLTSMQSSLDSRHETMQARVADLANNAFSCALRWGDLQMAVEVLEQGRGILWNQLARFDISIATLESQSNNGHELGNKFTQLSANLRKHAQGSRRKGMDPYWRIQEEWQSVVNEIRRQDGFSRFLLPPRFEDLQQAAECGPVIVVNASKYTCDALIVLHTQPPIRVPLNCSLDDVAQLCSQFSELIQDPHAYGGNRELWVKQSLRELWTTIVEQIVAVLQDDVQLPMGSRIWWCPTSKFTILPLHAAGPYRKDKKNLMDIYVSSYAPSLSALIRARGRARSQKAVRDASGTANVISFAVVGQARPRADLKLSELPEVEREIRRIRDETSMPPDVTFGTVTGDAATIEGAVQTFRDHRWVHLACHGSQHATKPFESWFAMGDGQLTLMRIIQERYPHSEFAFLSACHTAAGDKSTPDEVLHLAAGMQFAGFSGVIGTLWRVDDSIAHEVVTRFYREMFRHPVIDFEHAAVALNVAVVESAKEVPLEKRIVFVHIGI